MAKQYKFTEDGFKKLQDELDHLKNVARTEIAEKIKEARSFGDLSENSEYDEAKNEQARIESRISELENMLKNAVILDDDADAGKKVRLGSKVRVLDVELGIEDEFTIVGSAEADPMNGAISDESPVGKAMLDAKVGKTVIAETPAGELKYKIVAILK
ncbi:MAG: transcription elongation factor GreA [Clostridia bacterium]|nr:transcription elongation factor GreA [Clostridia bacterium]